MINPKMGIIVVDHDGAFIAALKRVFVRERLDQTFEVIGVVPQGIDMAQECLEGIHEVIQRNSQIAAVLLDVVFDSDSPDEEKVESATDRTGQEIAKSIRNWLPDTPIIAATSYTRVHSILVDLSFDDNIEGIVPKELLVGKWFSGSFLNEVIERGRRKRLVRGQASLQGEKRERQLPARVEAIASARNRFRIGEDPYTQYQISEIGEVELLTLLIGVFQDSTGVVRAFSPGFSGAFLFEARIATEPPGTSRGNETDWILKVSRNGSKLEEELSRHRELRVRGVPKEAYPALYSDEMFLVGEWACLVMEKELETVTLANFLETRSHEAIEVDVSRGLAKFLKQLYGESLRKSAAVWKDFYSLSARDTAAILRGFEATSATMRRLLGEQISVALKRVSTFVRSPSSEVGVVDVLKNVETRFVHGDLHARNILINPSSNAVVTIDYARSRQSHVAIDIAKLESDLVLSVMGANAGLDTEWGKISDWEALLSLVSCDSLVNTSSECLKAESAVGFYSRLIMELRKVLMETAGDISPQEYFIALLHFTLKALGYNDIQLPKKAFGVLLANRILGEIEPK